MDRSFPSSRWINMTRTRSFDIGEVLTSLMYLFWEKGYEATSLHDIVSTSGLSRSSLYRAFGSKRELFDRTLARYLTGFDTALAPLDNPGGVAGVRSFFTQWRGRVVDDGGGYLGCMIVNTITELAIASPEARKVADAYQQRLYESFLNSLTQSERSDTVAPELAARKARVLAVMTMGLFVASRGQDAPVITDHLDTIIAEIHSWQLAPV